MCNGVKKDEKITALQQETWVKKNRKKKSAYNSKIKDECVCMAFGSMLIITECLYLVKLVIAHWQ